MARQTLELPLGAEVSPRDHPETYYYNFDNSPASNLTSGPEPCARTVKILAKLHEQSPQLSTIRIGASDDSSKGLEHLGATDVSDGRSAAKSWAS